MRSEFDFLSLQAKLNKGVVKVAIPVVARLLVKFKTLLAGIEKDIIVADWPSELPGLDINTALNQLGGKKKLYLRLLGMFSDAHVQDVDKLMAAAQAQDWKLLYEVNHALKGVTGNLAASELYQLCIDIDHKLKEDQHDVEDLIAALPTAMQTLLASIEIASQFSLDE